MGETSTREMQSQPTDATNGLFRWPHGKKTIQHGWKEGSASRGGGVRAVGAPSARRERKGRHRRLLTQSRTAPDLFLAFSSFLAVDDLALPPFEGPLLPFPMFPPPARALSLPTHAAAFVRLRKTAPRGGR